MDEDEDASMMSVDDISSSTDPLLDTAATPASRSVTPAIPARQPASARRGRPRNQHQPTPRTQRVQALRESTPRKRMFELDVGDGRSPQRLLVTVEAESSRVTSRSSVSRRLFQHSTPTARSIRERERTTSVTVPLRGAEDDGDDEITRLGEFVTPARPRGRPPRTATPGTALRSETPKTTTRPMRPATPGFRLREARSSSKDVLDSDVTIDFSKLGFTPGTKRRISLTPGPSSRAPKRRKGVSGTSPMRQPSLLGPGSARRKRGRPRKDSISHDEFSALIERDLTALKEDVSDNEAGPQAESSRDQENRYRNQERNQDQEHTRRERTYQQAQSNVFLGERGIGAVSSDAPRPDESEGDIWLDNSFNPPQDTPAAQRWSRAPKAQFSRAEQLRPEPARRETPQLESELSHGDEYVEYADFGGGESHSDLESEQDDDNATPRDTPAGQPTETRLPGEEFTMIDPYSLLSMQQNSSYVGEQEHEGAQNEENRDGDTTSFYISKTIRSLRISQQEQESHERLSHNRTVDYSINPNATTTPRAPPPGYDPLYRYSTGDNNMRETEVVEGIEEEEAHEGEEAMEQRYSKVLGRQKSSEREREEEQQRAFNLNRISESEQALESESGARSRSEPEPRPEREEQSEPQHEPEPEPQEEPEESDLWFRPEPRKRQRREPQREQQPEPEPEREVEPVPESNTWDRREHRAERESDHFYEQEANRTRRSGVEREPGFEPISGGTPDFEPLPERRSESPEEPEHEPGSEPLYEEEQEQEHEQDQEFEDILESEQQQETEAEPRQEQAHQAKTRSANSSHKEDARPHEGQRNNNVRGDGEVESSARSMNYDQFERQESSVLYHGHLRRGSRGNLPPEPSSPLFRKSQTDVQQQTTKTTIKPSVERASSSPSPVPPEPRDYDFQYDFGTHANVETDDAEAELNNDEPRQPTESLEPVQDEEMPSSPPTGHSQKQRTEQPLRRVRSNSNETPADRLTSLASPNLPALNPQHLMPPPDSQKRPGLSPIIRAGEALRQVTSDPPSPPPRGSFLRSPFRGMPGFQDGHSPSPSGSRPSHSQSQSQPQPQPQPLPQAQFETTPQPHPERSGFGLFNSIKNLVAQGAQVLSPRNASRQTSVNNVEESSKQASAIPETAHTVDVTMEDPFGPDPPGSFRESFGRNSLFGNMMGKHASGSQDASGTASASASFENRDQASVSTSFERQSRASSGSDRQAYGQNNFGRQAEDYAGFGRGTQADAGFGNQRPVFGEPHPQVVHGFGTQRPIFGEPQPQVSTGFGFERPVQADTSFGQQDNAGTSFHRTEAQASSSHAIKQPSVTTRFNTQPQVNSSFGHVEAEDSTMHDSQHQTETSFASQHQASTNSAFTRQPQPRANTTFGSTRQTAPFSERERQQHEQEQEQEAMDWQTEEKFSHNVTRDRSASVSLGFHDSSHNHSRSQHDKSGLQRSTTSAREESSSNRRSASASHQEPEPEPAPAARGYGHGYREVIETETVTEEREEERVWGDYAGPGAKNRSSFRESSNHSSSRGHGARPEKSSTSNLRRSVAEQTEERERQSGSQPAEARRGHSYRETVEVETVSEEHEEEHIWGDYLGKGDARSRSSFRESSHSSSRHGHGRDGHSRHGSSSRHGSQRGSRQGSRHLSEERETTAREERGRSEGRSERGRSREVTEEIREEYEHEHETEWNRSGGRHSSAREEESRRFGSSRSSNRSGKGKAPSSSSRQMSEEQETREEQDRRQRGRSRETTEEIREEYEHEHESEHYHSGGRHSTSREDESRRQHGSSRSSNQSARDRSKASSALSSSRGNVGQDRPQSSGQEQEQEARQVLREVTEEVVEEERHEWEEERGGHRSSHVEESHRHWSRGGPRGSPYSRASESTRDENMRSSMRQGSRGVTEAEDERDGYEDQGAGQRSGYADESTHRQESQSGRGEGSWRSEQPRNSAERESSHVKEAHDDFAEESQHRTGRGSQETRQREAEQHRTSRQSQRESLLERGRTSSRNDQLRSSADRQPPEVEKARHDSYSGVGDYDMPYAEENHQREESPVEQRDEHEHEQDQGMDFMEEEERQHQADQAQEQAGDDEEEEEEDLFLLEAMRSSPAIKRKPQMKENDPASFLPSTHHQPSSSRWQSNKSQMVRDQLNTAANKSDDMGEEFSLLHSSRAKKFKPALKPVPNKKANLSGFFSSPAPIPDLSLKAPEGNTSLASPSEALNQQVQPNGKVLSGPGILSERAQNSAPGQAERKLGTTPISRVPPAQRLSVPGAQKPYHPSPLGTAPVLSGQPTASRPLQPQAQRVLRHSSSIVGSSSPPQAGSIYTPVPQKQNFTPLRREPGAKLPLFEPNGTKSGAATTTAAQLKDGSGQATTPGSITDKPKQLLFGIKESISKLFSDPPAKSVEYGQPQVYDNEDEHDNQENQEQDQEHEQEHEQEQQPAEEEDLVLDDFDEIVELEEEQSSTEEQEPFEPSRPLRALPDKNSSPLRSALRPSYKPRGQTPGRAVQFANSVRESPTPQRRRSNAGAEQRRLVFGGGDSRTTPVIITSSPSTQMESSPVGSPSVGEERMQEDRRARYEEEYLHEEEERKPDVQEGMDVDVDVDLDMDDSIQWYDDEPAPAPAARQPSAPRPMSPQRGRQQPQQQQQEEQREAQVAAMLRQAPQPPLSKPISKTTLENSPVIRSGVSLFGHGRRRPLPPPIPPSKRNIVTPLQPLEPSRPLQPSQQLYPTLPPLSPLGQQQPAQSSSSALASTSQHLNSQISTGASTSAGSSTLTRASASASVVTDGQLPPPTPLWTPDHWSLLSHVIHSHRNLNPSALVKGKRPLLPVHLQSFLGRTFRPTPSQTTYDPVSGRPIDESVVIEQWHLDVVYEFREMFRRVWERDELYGKVFRMVEEERGGWSEGELVRRVYAFLVGERRRREGRVDRGRRRGIVR
ncbi:hypothetical protein B0T20DRAFT_250189 [Sordaria brevicollis]|uniref:Uncharacterized protein n=1 Tax=Sordaria brevicollis TaxID=83679 RepID=A0AAE0PC24_SORBR|nr:hypothetical protein B0T20DRAFT_250189 [Sordaria brevicollis]